MYCYHWLQQADYQAFKIHFPGSKMKQPTNEHRQTQQYQSHVIIIFVSLFLIYIQVLIIILIPYFVFLPDRRICVFVLYSICIIFVKGFVWCFWDVYWWMLVPPELCRETDLFSQCLTLYSLNHKNILHTHTHILYMCILQTEPEWTSIHQYTLNPTTTQI